jgi:hypothetical protein
MSSSILVLVLIKVVILHLANQLANLLRLTVLIPLDLFHLARLEPLIRLDGRLGGEVELVCDG